MVNKYIGTGFPTWLAKKRWMAMLATGFNRVVKQIRAIDFWAQRFAQRR